MEFEHQPFAHFVGEIFSISSLCTVKSQLGQVVGFELDAVELVVSAQLLNLSLGIGLAHHHFAVLVACELVEEVFLRIFLAVFLFRAEVFRDGEGRHDGSMVDGVELHLVADVHGGGQRLRHICKYLAHFLSRLEPLLLGVKHTVRVVQFLARAEAYQAVVRLGVFLVDEVHVVGTHQPDAILLAVFLQVLVHFELQGIGLMVGAGDGGLVELQLQVVVVAEHAFVPLHGLLSRVKPSDPNHAGHFPAQTGGADDESLVVFFQFDAVGARAHVVAFGPGFGHELDEVVIAFQVFGQHDEVVAALVGLAIFVEQAAVGHVHLAADDGFEQFPFGFGQTGLAGGYLRLRVVGLFLAAFERRDALFEVFDFIFDLAVLLVDVVIKFLHAEHVAVVGQGHAPHAVGYGFVDEALDAGLSVEDGVLAMDV